MVYITHNLCPVSIVTAPNVAFARNGCNFALRAPVIFEKKMDLVESGVGAVGGPYASLAVKALRNPYFRSGVRWASRKAYAGLKRKFNERALRKAARRKVLRKKDTVYAAVSGGNTGGNLRRIKRKYSRKGSSKKTLKSLSKKVNKLTKKVNINYSRFDSFQNDAYSLASAINRCNYGSYDLTTPGSIEAALAKLPYANPADFATKDDLNTLGMSKPAKWHVKTHARHCIRNNYLHPVTVDIYVVQPKVDTSNSPSTSVTTGLTAMEGESAVVTTSPSFYPTTSKYFVDAWKILRHEKRVLEAGAEFIVSHNETYPNYDHKFVDVNTATYLKRYSRVLLVRIQGVCSHDVTTATNVGWGEAQVDMIVQRKVTVLYPGNFIPIRGIADAISVDTIADDEVAVQDGAVHDEL